MKRALSIATLALVALLTAFTAGSGHASAQTALVTDYANYPATAEAQIPPGCDGGGLFHSEMFSLRRLGELNGSAPVHDPHNLPEFHEGDTLTMTWDATTQACVGAPVVLVIKVAQGPTFDLTVNQRAKVPYAATVSDGGPGSLSYTLPPLESFGFNCSYQLDAIVGLPLAVVGPSGSDYSPGNRQVLGKPGSDDRSTLIGFRNGAYETCAAPPTTTTTAPETTTTAPAPTTTEAPPTTAAPVVVTTQPETLQVARPAPAAAPAPAHALATTGAHASGLLIAGLCLVAAGLTLVLGRRLMLTRYVNKRTQP